MSGGGLIEVGRLIGNCVPWTFFKMDSLLSELRIIMNSWLNVYINRQILFRIFICYRLVQYVLIFDCKFYWYKPSKKGFIFPLSCHQFSSISGTSSWKKEPLSSENRTDRIRHVQMTKSYTTLFILWPNVVTWCNSGIIKRNVDIPRP